MDKISNFSSSFNNYYLNPSPTKRSSKDKELPVDGKDFIHYSPHHVGELGPFPISITWDPVSICALLNLGSTDVTGIKKDPSIQIAFLKDALRLARYYDPQATGDISKVLEQLDRFILLEGHESAEFLLEKLKQQGDLDLYSGYADHPSGHAVWVRLTWTDTGTILGKIVQTGEGVHYHGKASTAAHREQCVPEILLKPATSEEVWKSRFLHQLIAVKKTIAFKDNPFNIYLFYGTCVAAWPGKVQQGNAPSKGLQRGGTCSMKVFLRFLEDHFSPHLYPKIKLYLRIYSIWSLIDAHPDLHHFGLGRIKTALNKCRQTLVKQQLSPQDPAYQLFVALEKKLTQQEEQIKATLCQYSPPIGKTLAPSIFLMLPSDTLALSSLEQITQCLGKNEYHLSDLPNVLVHLKALSQQNAGLYALHVLSHLPLAETWPALTFPDFVTLCRDLQKLLKPILHSIRPKKKKNSFALTPRHYAAFINLAGGLVKAAKHLESPHYAQWLENFFPKPDALPPLPEPRLKALFDSGASYLQQGTSFTIFALRKAFAFDREHCSSQSVQKHPLLLALQEYSGLSWQAVLKQQTSKRSIFSLPIDLHLLLILTSYHARPLPKVLPSLTHKYAVESPSSPPLMHWMHLDGLSSLTPSHACVQSYYPWTPEDVTFINSLFLPPYRSSNEALTVLQEGDDFGGVCLGWQELLLLRSILHTPGPQILQLFEYLTTYPHRQRQEPFQALALMLAAVITKSASSIATSWINDFFDTHLSEALKAHHLPQTSFLLRFFAQVQAFHPESLQDLEKAIKRVQRHTGWSLTQRSFLAWELIALTPYLSSSVYPLLKGELQRAPTLRHTETTSSLLKEDFVLGRAKLWNTFSLADSKKSETLPPHILAHEDFPFLEKFPSVLEKKKEGNTVTYSFLDEDGALCSIVQTNPGGLFFIKEFESQRYILQTFPKEILQLCEFSHFGALYGGNLLFDPHESNYWVSEQSRETALIVTKGYRHAILARCRSNKVFHPVHQEWYLASTKHYPTPLLKMDAPEYTVPWVDENNLLVCIEYPRLRLVFFWDAEHSCYKEGKAPHRRVLDQSLLEFNTAIPYLVLERPSGIKDVMVTEFAFHPQKVSLNEKSSSQAHYGENISKFFYTLSPEGTLLAGQDKTANLFLIALLLQNGLYERARDLAFDLVRHPFLWSSKEREWLNPGVRFYPPKDWEDEEDHHGAISAVRLKLLFSAYPLDHELSSSHRYYAIRDYSNYLDQINSVGKGFLSLEEEKRAITLWQAQKGKVSPAAALRAQALGLDSVEAQPATYSILMQERQCQPLPPQANFLSLDPQSFSIASGSILLSYYTVLQNHALKGSKRERRILREAMIRLIFDANSNVRYHAAAIHLAADHLIDRWNEADVWNHLMFLQSKALAKLPFLTLHQGAVHSKPLPAPLEPNAPPSSLEINLMELDRAAAILEVLHEPYFPQDPQALHSPLPMHPRNRELLDALRSIYDISTKERCIQNLVHKKQIGIEHFASSLQKHEEKLVNQQKPYYNPRLLDPHKKRIDQSLRKGIADLETKTKSLRLYLEDQLQRRYQDDARRYNLPPPMTLQEVTFHLARKDILEILSCYPSLELQLPSLKKQIADYLVHATELQLLQRAQSALACIKKSLSPLEKANAEEKFIATLSAKRQYHQDPDHAFAYLVFEHITNRRLFGRQIALLADLLQACGQYNVVAETGFGKSSTLLPLWLFLTSTKNEGVTAITVPSSLLKDTVKNLKEVLGPLGSLIHQLEFDRDKLQDHRIVEKLCLDLEQSKKSLFVMSMNTAQLLNDLALKEALIEGKSVILTRSLKRLRLLWKEKIRNMVDESSELLGSDEHVYATGNLQAFSWAHRARATQFYTDILLHPAILNKWAFSFFPTDSQEKKEITTDTYPELKEDLIRILLEKEHTSPSSKKSSKDIASYLRGNESASCDHYETLRYWKNQLNSLLPSTLVAKYGSRYQVFCNDGRFLAVPCMAGVMRPSYEFANLNELINFTMQANLAHPLPPSFIEQIASFFPSEVKTGEASLEDQKIWEQLLERAQISYIKNKKDFRQLASHLNTHPLDKALFISIAILRKITTYSHKIASTSQTFVLSHQTHGTSATVNSDILPPIIKTKERPKVGMGNLLALIEKDAKVYTLKSSSPIALLQESLRQGHYDALVDQAGLFSELSIKQIQQAIFEEMPSCQGVYFYDTHGHPMLWRRGKSHPSAPKHVVSLQKTFIYLAESKAVGTDAPMLPDTKMLVTIDWRTSHSRLEQAIGRARSLRKGQSVNFVTTQKSWDLILKFLDKEQITLPSPLGNLLRYALWQEGPLSSKEYYLALQRYPLALLEQQIWQAPKSLWALLFSKLESFFKIPIEGENPILPTGKSLPAKKAVDQIRLHFFNTLAKKLELLPKNLSEHICLETIREQFEEYARHYREHLTEYVNTHETCGRGQLVAAQVETQTETAAARSQHKINYIEFSPTHDSSIASHTHLLEMDIAISTSMLKVSTNSSLANEKLKKKAYYYLLKMKNKRPKIYCIDIYDKESVKSYIDSGCFLLKDDKIIDRPSQKASLTHLSDLIKDPKMLQRVLLISHLFKRPHKLSPQEKNLLSIQEQKKLIAWAHNVLGLELLVE